MSIIKAKTLEIIFSLSCCCYLFVTATGKDTILQGEELRDWQYLYSASKLFRLQFFIPRTSRNRYLGVFYNIPDPGSVFQDNAQPVWVANRDEPIPDASGALMIDKSDVMLKIFYVEGNAVLVSNTPSPVVEKLHATLVGNGNFGLRELHTNSSISPRLWQSFDYPTETLLPGLMELGINFKTGHKWSLTSWISQDYPASGSFTMGGDPNRTNQLFIWWQRKVYRRSGLWRNGHFYNINLFNPRDFPVLNYIANENEKYLTFSVPYLQTDHLVDLRIAICMENCSCTGFASRSDNYGTWEEISGRRSKYVDYTLENGREVYVVGNTPALETGNRKRGGRGKIWLIPAVGGPLWAFSVIFFLVRRYLKLKGMRKRMEKLLLLELVTTSSGKFTLPDDEIDSKMRQVHLFKFESIEMATNNFSAENKLGAGGFGPVYKGALPSGQEIAIKRLSGSSGQGLLEFKNEIQLLPRLQHNNLVRLVGCCIEHQEKILVYEYMPNKSLDFFLFDPSKRELLKWNNRMMIVEGVAQGLVYLHKYSRLRVIHRDLKAGNILLDQNMNPKISDFGMARIFGTQDSEENTKRIVGTRGYMSPEYAIKGIVSIKTDVFSFGVLLLEIVSGKRNHGRHHSERPLNLIGLAWELWVEGRGLELMDPTLDDDLNDRNEIMRCINVGLLCVQDTAADRPSMTEVVSMLTKEPLQLPPPRQPAFFIETNAPEADKEAEIDKTCTNGLSISEMEAR